MMLSKKKKTAKPKAETKTGEQTYRCISVNKCGVIRHKAIGLPDIPSSHGPPRTSTPIRFGTLVTCTPEQMAVIEERYGVELSQDEVEWHRRGDIRAAERRKARGYFTSAENVADPEPEPELTPEPEGDQAEGDPE